MISISVPLSTIKNMRSENQNFWKFQNSYVYLGRHEIAELLLKLALNTNQSINAHTVAFWTELSCWCQATQTRLCCLMLQSPFQNDYRRHHDRFRNINFSNGNRFFSFLSQCSLCLLIIPCWLPLSDFL